MKFETNTTLLNPKKVGRAELQVMALVTATSFLILPLGEPTIKETCLAHLDEE